MLERYCELENGSLRKDDEERDNIRRYILQKYPTVVEKYKKDHLKTKSRVCLKNHSHNLHAPLCGIFYPNSVAVARYGALIRAKSPTNCDAHLAESLFQTCSSKDVELENQSNEMKTEEEVRCDNSKVLSEAISINRKKPSAVGNFTESRSQKAK